MTDPSILGQSMVLIGDKKKKNKAPKASAALFSHTIMLFATWSFRNTTVYVLI